MKERPILFNGEMVRAILDGRKTQTRRVIKGSRKARGKTLIPSDFATEELIKNTWECKYGVPGDRLWVRESWCESFGGDKAHYKADGGESPGPNGFWRPSIHMPRWASRITLEVIRTWVERVQDISEKDAVVEGVPRDDDFPLDNRLWCPRCDGQGVHSALGQNLGVTEVDCDGCDTAKKLFRNLWNSINEKRGFGWDKNNLVRVVEFKRV